MYERRPVTGRPSGTDGSDYSYRMVVDSRYTKVAKGKSRLSRLLLIQIFVFLTGSLLAAIPVFVANGPHALAVSSVVLYFVSLLIGESGRRHSRISFLKMYLILSSVAMVLSITYIVKSNFVLQIFRDGILSSWERRKLPVLEAAHVFSGVLMQAFATITTLSLIDNMSLPKRSS